MIQSAHKPAHGVVATIFGVVILLLGASGGLYEMQDALNTIWKVDTTSKTGVWNMAQYRFLSFGMVLASAFCCCVSLLLSAALTAVATYASSLFTHSARRDPLDGFLFSVFFIAALMALIFKFLPDTKVAWGDVWVGARSLRCSFSRRQIPDRLLHRKKRHHVRIRSSRLGSHHPRLDLLLRQLPLLRRGFTHVYSKSMHNFCIAHRF